MKSTFTEKAYTITKRKWQHIEIQKLSHPRNNEFMALLRSAFWPLVDHAEMSIEAQARALTPMLVKHDLLQLYWKESLIGSIDLSRTPLTFDKCQTSSSSITNIPKNTSHLPTTMPGPQ